MFGLKDYFFEIQFLLNIVMITSIVALVFLYLKLSMSKKNPNIVEKIEYLCKNLKDLVDKSEKSSDIIQQKIEEFKMQYNKNISEIEKKTSDITAIVERLEHNENISDKLQEKDKYLRIKDMIGEGHSVDTIARMLKITKGEVELVYNIIKAPPSS